MLNPFRILIDKISFFISSLLKPANHIIIKLKLIVIKTTNIDKLVKFYQLIGLSFDKHQHGKGAIHYATIINDTVFEIYLLQNKELKADNSLRLGFEIPNLMELITELEFNLIKIIAYPKQTEFGLMAIVEDFDGRKIELYNDDEFSSTDLRI